MVCCFIGHRKVENKELVLAKVKEIVSDLIVNKHVRIFNFGSKSEFDDICHAVVSDFQKTFPDIVRIHYHRKGEYTPQKEEKEKIEQWWRDYVKEEKVISVFEEGRMSDRVWKAGKASYIERNQEMIDHSQYCIFFYREDYLPEQDKKRNTSGKSGTKLAYEYAVRKRKVIINVAK